MVAAPTKNNTITELGILIWHFYNTLLRMKCQGKFPNLCNLDIFNELKNSLPIILKLLFCTSLAVQHSEAYDPHPFTPVLCRGIFAATEMLCEARIEENEFESITDFVYSYQHVIGYQLASILQLQRRHFSKVLARINARGSRHRHQENTPSLRHGRLTHLKPLMMSNPPPTIES